MGLHLLSFFMIVLLGKILANEQPSLANEQPSYDENYNIAFGADHVWATPQGRDVQLFLDQSSGSGIQSKMTFGSGFFHLRIKLPANDSAGVVTAFYMTSLIGDELDFEFLGNREGKPYILQTNVFTNGIGGREQRIHLWFDPTESFHTYRILWNPNQIVFFIDYTPIRVFKNKRDIGVGYPTQPMQVVASIWNGDNWATDGGQTKIDWNYAPFIAHFRSFGIDGCTSNFGTGCYSSKFWWNREQYWSLSPDQESQYEGVKNTYMNYDYCNDRTRYPTPPPECPQ